MHVNIIALSHSIGTKISSCGETSVVALSLSSLWNIDDILKHSNRSFVQTCVWKKSPFSLVNFAIQVVQSLRRSNVESFGKTNTVAKDLSHAFPNKEQWYFRIAIACYSSTLH